MLHLCGMDGTDVYTLAQWASTPSSMHNDSPMLRLLEKEKLKVCPDLLVPPITKD